MNITDAPKSNGADNGTIIELTSEELKLAINTWLVAHQVKLSGPQILYVDGIQPSKATLWLTKPNPTESVEPSQETTPYDSDYNPLLQAIMQHQAWKATLAPNIPQPFGFLLTGNFYEIFAATKEELLPINRVLGCGISLRNGTACLGFPKELLPLMDTKLKTHNIQAVFLTNSGNE